MYGKLYWDPYYGIKVNETGDPDYKANKDINVNEEITFDYAKRNYTVDYL